jgi:hypothetical protein
MPRSGQDDPRRRAQPERQPRETQKREPQKPAPATDLDAPATPDSTPPEYNTWHTGP